MVGTPFTVFGTTGFMYAILLPLIVMQVMALIFIPSMMTVGSKALHVGKAVFCYLMQGLGVMLMSMSGLPAVYSVLVGAPLSGNMYLSLVLIFAIGGFVFLWHDHKVMHIDDASRMVPYALFFYTVKFIGALAIIGALLSLALTMLTMPRMVAPGFWILPTLFLLYGLILAACTKWPRMHGSFQMNPMKKPPMPAVKPPVMVAQKPKPPMNKNQAQAMQSRKK